MLSGFNCRGHFEVLIYLSHSLLACFRPQRGQWPQTAACQYSTSAQCQVGLVEETAGRGSKPQGCLLCNELLCSSEKELQPHCRRSQPTGVYLSLRDPPLKKSTLPQARCSHGESLQPQNMSTVQEFTMNHTTCRRAADLTTLQCQPRMMHRGHLQVSDWWPSWQAFRPCRLAAFELTMLCKGSCVSRTAALNHS